ncbi:nuclear hormone receptor E75-like protein, partial [Euroglyphus maynei]
LVQKINKRLEEVLQKAIATNHHKNFPNNSSDSVAAAANTLFLELTKKIPDLRTLNALHSDKLLGKSFGGLEQQSSNINMSTCSQKDAAAYGHIHRSTPRIDSPTDSGIESGKETHSSNGSASTPTPSVCSSPQSAIEDSVTKDHIHHCTSSDSETGIEKHETIDDMPVLKRALQAPPLVNTNKLMDEAYRHHKKFRAAARNCNGSRAEEPHSPSTTSSTNNRTAVVTSTPTGVITSHSSSSTSTTSQLASTHSTLLKTLEQPSRYMNEQQLKRTDLIHNIIMNTETVQTPATTPISMSILKDSSVAATAPVQQYHHQPKHNQYQSDMFGMQQQQQQQVTVIYASQNSGYPYSHHISSNGGGCPFSSEQNRTVSNSSPTLQYHQQQPIYRKSPSPSYLVMDQQNSSQKILAINNIPTAAHSPTSAHSRPSSSLSNHSSSSNGGGHPFSHLQRCLTATVAPSQEPILLQTAAQITDNELDCQPLNLSKKAASLSSSSLSFGAIHSTPPTISSSMIKIEVDPQNA